MLCCGVQWMNTSERVAYEWLLGRGYVEEDITLRSNQTPDFVTSNGAAFEVKLLYGNSIRFSSGQVDKILAHGNVTVLPVKDSEVLGELDAQEFEARPPKVGSFSVSYMEGTTTIKVPKSFVEQLGEVERRLARMGWGTLDEELHPYFEDGINRGAVLEAALHLLVNGWNKETDDDGENPPSKR